MEWILLAEEGQEGNTGEGTEVNKKDDGPAISKGAVTSLPENTSHELAQVARGRIPRRMEQVLVSTWLTTWNPLVMCGRRTVKSMRNGKDY